MLSFREFFFGAWASVFLLGGLLLLGRLVFDPERRRRWLASGVLPPSPLSIFDFLMLLWMIVTGSYIGQMLVRSLLVVRLQELPEADTWETLSYGAGFHLGSLFGCLCFQIYLRKKFPFLPVPADAGRPSWGGRVLAGAATFATVWPLLLAVGFLWMKLLTLAGLPTEQQDLVAIFARTGSPRLLAVLIVLAIVVAPINEELIFRAGLYRFVRARLPRTAAILLSAVAFAAIHANWVSLVPLVLLGSAFALAYEKTGRIEVPMIAHGLFNLNTILFILAGAANP